MNDFIPRHRLAFLALCAAVLTLGLLFKYGSAMLTPRKESIQPRILVERGSILDRNGKILAVQTTLYNIAVTRSAIPNKPLCANLLSAVISIPEEEILDLLDREGSDFLYLKKKISESEKVAVVDVIEKNRLRGIRLESVQSRTYPENNLASHLVGFLGDDGHGLTGVEYSFQDILSAPITDKGPAHEGYNVMLTIDNALQYELSKISSETMKETKAEAVMMVVANAKTGEILAYISEPSANLNEYTTSTPSQRVDRPALYAYEPGSVFKIFSTAALLDLGSTADEREYLCDGGYSLESEGRETIHIKCLSKHGRVRPRDVIRLSCNDGMGQMAERASSRDFEAKLRALGFGSKTNIELPGETTGIFASTDQWSIRSKPTIAIGQEISVSALQMVEAATALANQGELLKLTILSRLYTRDGLLVYEHKRTSLGKVLDSTSAQLVLSYMQSTSESGTGTKASVGDVPMAVKTGTAQMMNASGGGYSDKDFISSCIGIFPAHDPQIIVYLAIIKPVGETYGGRIAAPVISRAANIIIDSLGMGRAQATSVKHTGLVAVPKSEKVLLGSTMPDLTGVPKRLLSPLFSRTDISIKISGNGYVVEQFPPPGTPVEKGMIIELRLE